MFELQKGVSTLAIIVASERGGVRKTATVVDVATYFGEVGIDVRLIQTDRQGRLEALFPDQVRQIDMPNAEAMRNDDLADAEALAPLYDLLLNPKPGVDIVDTGANVDGRLFDWAYSTHIGSRCQARGAQVVCLIPMTTDADAINLAARTAKRFGAAFPGRMIIPVLCEDGGNFSALADAGARQVFASAFGDSIAAGRCIKHPRLYPGALRMLQATGKSPADFAEMDEDSAARLTGQHPSKVGQAQADVTVHVAAITEELARIFRCGNAG
jgi:hypothetical protein